MSIKSMYIFNKMTELSIFTNELEKIDWKIEKEYLKDRAIFYAKLKIFTLMKQTFLDKKISIFALKDEEVITWIDTLTLLRRLLLILFKQGVDTDKISIIMEYPLIFGNHMRADYLLIYDQLIIVLEFGMFNQDERRSEERYTKKLQESNSYRQLLANLINSKIEVVNYVMIYRPEYSRNQKQYLKENILYNNEELHKLVKFISHLIKLQDVSRPMYQLAYLNNIN
ncbi:hypothetical protein [Mariniplasma anaerobium]|uniref:Uncharacterized protein n=1 Tax=Mariniplasma anaerobium TaxID=2735436 RepID=A0A7U9XW16_9MOLU|nr:hypothetical protein [Mariniplasma anaerobium]BCR35323.1 hypothetical protein MPAN_002160 [Mariniplasma anaerobium]